jgi:hypothetical protein
VPHRWLVLSVGLAACGGSPPPAAKTPPPRRIAAESTLVPSRPRNTLYRDEILLAKRVGLGHVFELMDLEPVGDLDSRGRLADFKGFQIRALRPAREWLAFDFAPGDILTHFNGVSVEHYATWYEQFEALGKADQIRVDLIQDESKKTVIVKIVDRASRTAPASPQTARLKPESAASRQTPSDTKLNH